MAKQSYADRLRAYYTAAGVHERRHAPSLARACGISSRTAHSILMGRPVRTDSAQRVAANSPIPVTAEEVMGWPS